MINSIQQVFTRHKPLQNPKFTTVFLKNLLIIQAIISRPAPFQH